MELLITLAVLFVGYKVMRQMATPQQTLGTVVSPNQNNTPAILARGPVVTGEPGPLNTTAPNDQPIPAVQPYGNPFNGTSGGLMTIKPDNSPVDVTATSQPVNSSVVDDMTAVHSVLLEPSPSPALVPSTGNVDQLIMTTAAGAQVFQRPNGDTYTVWP
jgi:hypothetical protein